MKGTGKRTTIKDKLLQQPHVLPIPPVWSALRTWHFPRMQAPDRGCRPADLGCAAGEAVGAGGLHQNNGGRRKKRSCEVQGEVFSTIHVQLGQNKAERETKGITTPSTTQSLPNWKTLETWRRQHHHHLLGGSTEKLRKLWRLRKAQAPLKLIPPPCLFYHFFWTTYPW